MSAKGIMGLMLFLSASCPAETDHLPQTADQAREALLHNVRMINSGGAPGVVLCISPNAFPVVGATCGRSVQPVAAACFYGYGRVLAVGHPSFYTEEGTSKADTAAFIKNSIRWLGQGKSSVAVYKNGLAAKALKGLTDVAVQEITSLDVLSSFPVLAVYPDSLKPDEIERVRAFITAGGGLLASGIGWGWLQVSGGKSLATENLFNRLLGPAGLLITGDMAGRTAPDGYLSKSPLPSGVNACEAIALASSGKVSDKALLRQISHTLCAVKSALPPQESSLSRALDVLMNVPEASKIPSPTTPLTAADIPARLAFIQHQAAWRAKPFDAWPAHPAAAVYPGLPPVGTPRGCRILSINLDIPRWHGTGLFAVAGDPITVDIPNGAEKLGLKLRIGSTTCDNTRHDDWFRAPKVDLEVPLKTRHVTVTSPFGGLLYVIVPAKADSSERTIKVTLRNACQAAWFKEGRDSLSVWQTSIRNSPAPWAELESGKIILAVPANVIRTLDNPSALLAFWERVADQDATLASIPTQRRSAERFCSDAQLCAGWMHAGYPIMIPNVTAKDLIHLDTLKTTGDWGFFHELGHNHQNGDWTFDGTGEVTVNFFTLCDLERICGIPPRQTRMGKDDIQQSVLKWAANGKRHDDWRRDPFLALETFVRIQQVYGWRAFEKLFAEYHTLPDEKRPKNDSEKRDQWAIRLSRITGQNIATIFEAWHIPLSEDARQTCSRYPVPVDPRLFENVL